MESSHIAWEENSQYDSIQEWTVDQLSDQFQKAVDLCKVAEEENDNSGSEGEDEESEQPNNDHNEEQGVNSSKVFKPYKNKYMARVLLVEMKTAISRQIDKLARESECEVKSQVLTERLHAVLLQLGLIAVSVQEPSTGEEHFTTIVSALCDNKAYHPRRINLFISALNQLGLLWAERFEHEKAKVELLKASESYKQYRDMLSDKPPVSISDLFMQVAEEISSSSIPTVSDEDANGGVQGQWTEFEQLHTYTLYYLAQVCERLDEHEDAARFCHATLHRQLVETSSFNPLDWCKNAAFLASFYYARKNYRTGRYLLSSSWAVLTQEALPSATVDINQCSLYETLKADVAALMGSYCLKLLQDSESLMEDGEISKPPQPSEKASAQWEQKCFVGLDGEKVENVEAELPCEMAREYSEASAIFKAGLRYLQLAANHYTLEDHASRNVEVVQSISRLYQCLASFEPAPDRQSKMHKRRVDMLTHLLQELNPQFYLQSCRQLRYELAETLAKMAACKELPSPDDLSAQQSAKVTALNMSSIKQYRMFLDSFRTPEGNMPEEYPDEAERAALVAYFHMGRLWSRMKSTNRSILVTNLQNAINNFKEVLDYVQRHPASEEKVQDEFSLCKEMVTLLPHKLARIANSTGPL